MKYSDVDEFERFAYTNPIVSTTMKYMSIANSTKKSFSTIIVPISPSKNQSKGIIPRTKHFSMVKRV